MPGSLTSRAFKGDWEEWIEALDNADVSAILEGQGNVGTSAIMSKRRRKMPGVAKRSGGKRSGAGRKINPAVPRCWCGKHTLARAIRLRLKCKKKV